MFQEPFENSFLAIQVNAVRLPTLSHRKVCFSGGYIGVSGDSGGAKLDTRLFRIFATTV